MNLFAISSIILCISSLLMALLISLKGFKTRIGRTWFVFCISVVWWGIGGYKFSTSTSKENAFLWWQIAMVSIIITPIIYYQFVYTFLKLNTKRYKVILLTAYF